jgi:hypothetical protein
MVIARSTDDGHTFTLLMKINVGAHGPPVLYADTAGDVIAVVASRMNPVRSDTGIYKFPHGDWTQPVLLGSVYYGWDSKYTADVSPTDVLWYLHGGPVRRAVVSARRPRSDGAVGQRADDDPREGDRLGERHDGHQPLPASELR